MKSADPTINNAFYDDLGTRWYEDVENPVAILRVESITKLNWVRSVMQEEGVKPGSRILDIGCGAGFLANPLAANGYQVTGIDLSKNSLEVAAKYGDPSNPATYRCENALNVKDPDGSYDAVLMMDFLEHIEDPIVAIREAARLLKPGGLLFYHTFNRNPLSWLIVIKLIEWLARDYPEHMHVYRLFIKPSELREYCERAGISVQKVVGLRPIFATGGFWRTVFTRRLDPGFQFAVTNNQLLGYMGYGHKK